MTTPISISLADGQHIHIHLGNLAGEGALATTPSIAGARRRPLVLATAAIALFAAGYVVHDGTMPALAQPSEIASLSPESLSFQPPPQPRQAALAPARAAPAAPAGFAPGSIAALTGPPMNASAAAVPTGAGAPATRTATGEPRPSPVASNPVPVAATGPTPAARLPAAAQNAFGLE